MRVLQNFKPKLRDYTLVAGYIMDYAPLPLHFTRVNISQAKISQYTEKNYPLKMVLVI